MTDEQQQQNYTVTTTIHRHKKINLYTYPVQFSIEEVDYSQTYLLRCTPSRGIWQPRGVLHKVIMTFWLWVILQVRLTFSQTNPPVEVSSGDEQYYIRLT